MILCICTVICWIITVFSLAFLLRRKADKKFSRAPKFLLLCCFSFLAFFYFPHRNMFQNAEPLQIGLTSIEKAAPGDGVSVSYTHLDVYKRQQFPVCNHPAHLRNAHLKQLRHLFYR